MIRERIDSKEPAMSMDWFERNWMFTGVVAGLFLLSLVPLLAGGWSLPLILIYLQLPIYLFHQLEEHYDDRFRRFVNERVAGGRQALTTPAVVFINVPGVRMTSAPYAFKSCTRSTLIASGIVRIKR